MEGYKINYTDYDEFNALMRTSLIIKFIYNKLLKLEFKEKKGSEEYLNLLNLLEKERTKEDKLYQMFGFTSEKCEAWLTLLYNSHQDKNILEKSIEENPLILNPLERISYNLKKIVNKQKQPQISHEINERLYLDYFLLLLSLLEDNKNSYTGQTKAYILKNIYSLIYINRDLENILVKRKFAIPHNIVISNPKVAFKYDLPAPAFNTFKNIIFLDLSNNLINSLLKINDDSLKNYLKINEIIYKKSAFNVCLMLLGYESRKFLEGLMNTYFANSSTDTYYTQSIVLGCLEETEEQMAKKLKSDFPLK